MSKEVILNLDESEITKLQDRGYLDKPGAVSAEKIAEALHDLIGELETVPREYTFEITCTKDLIINDDLYWEKGCVYSVSTSDFTEFIAESNYGDSYLNSEDFAECFDISEASNQVIMKGLEAAPDGVCQIFASLAVEVIKAADMSSKEAKESALELAAKLLDYAKAADENLEAVYGCTGGFYKETLEMLESVLGQDIPKKKTEKSGPELD